MFDELFDEMTDPRAVQLAHYTGEDFEVDTIHASPRVSILPYETAVACLEYREDGRWVIVEAYDTEEAALEGHHKWVEIIRDPAKRPAELVDCCNWELMTGQDIRWSRMRVQ